ncbi:MAG: GntR family transcriptional regulator [Lachnospiraceae bacterium]|nr:GntR family transcriptional regulator [Lachnospiraceae bacterium]
MKTAKYQQVIDWVNAGIASGNLKSGDRLETEQEISRRFGLSRQTVRHALSILEQDGTLERIQGSGSYVKERRRARTAEVTLSRTVTIISSYLDGYIFPRLLKSMVDTLQKEGYSSRIMFTSNQVEKERSLLEEILAEGARDPMIVEPVMSGLPSPNVDYYQKISDCGVPILFFNSFYPDLDIPHVCMNDEEAGRIATDYVISQGHRKIAGIFKADDGQGRYRYKGYLKALYAAGIRFQESRVCWIDTQEQRQMCENSERILERLAGCTACVCYNDEVAHRLTKICAGKFIRIPQELSVVSIDNSELARLNGVPLTSVVHPMEIMGKKVAENLLRMIENPDYPATFEFVPDIKIRESVIPLSQTEFVSGKGMP